MLGGEELGDVPVGSNLAPLHVVLPVRLVQRLQVQERGDAVEVLGDQVRLVQDDVFRIKGRERRERRHGLDRRRHGQLHEHGIHEKRQAPVRLVAPRLRLSLLHRDDLAELLTRFLDARQLRPEQVQPASRVHIVPEEAALVGQDKGDAVVDLARLRVPRNVDHRLEAAEHGADLVADRVAERVRGLCALVGDHVLVRGERVLLRRPGPWRRGNAGGELHRGRLRRHED
mmetsp:Transcript_13185/g.44061  ORF Transcript_13185/g.44061 Transcript_13185/m.44061 type:complete len:229 (+) Transcript_13185:2876-3562(+)